MERLRYLAARIRGNAEKEAAIQQYLGMAHFAAGRYAPAAQSFGRALSTRVAAGATPGLIYSSTTAVRRADDLAEQAAP